MTKRPEELALMAESGKLLAQVFGRLDQLDLIGMSTMQVNDLVDSFIVHELKARPASKGQYGIPQVPLAAAMYAVNLTGATPEWYAWFVMGLALLLGVSLWAHTIAFRPALDPAPAAVAGR
jgi:hypothetical protein